MSNHTYEIGTVRTTVGHKTTVHGYVPVVREPNGKRRWLTKGYYKTREKAEKVLADITSS